MKIKGHFMTFGRRRLREAWHEFEGHVDWQSDKRLFLKPRIGINMKNLVFFQRMSVDNPINEITGNVTLLIFTIEKLRTLFDCASVIFPQIFDTRTRVSCTICTAARARRSAWSDVSCIRGSVVSGDNPRWQHIRDGDIRVVHHDWTVAERDD